MLKFDPSDLVRADLKELAPYDARVPPHTVKLDANENPHDFPPEVLECIWQEMKQEIKVRAFNRYPDSMAGALRDKLADLWQVDPACIMAGNGSDELILNLMLTFGSGGRVIITTPTFSMYGVHARVAGAAVQEVPRREDFSLDEEVLLREAGLPEIKKIVICNPNNPTGNAVMPDRVAAVLENTGALVVVDEAYGEFGGESCIPLLAQYPNLVVLRTFSKAYSLAGLRVGYLLAPAGIIEQLLKVKQPYNLSIFSQVAARLVLEHLPVFQARVDEILKERESLYEKLAGLPGVKVFPSEANFILFRTPLPANRVYHGLLEGGVLIRNVSGPLLPDFLRVTVGRSGENEFFLAQLKRVLEG